MTRDSGRTGGSPPFLARRLTGLTLCTNSTPMDAFYAGPESAGLLGYHPEELIGRPYFTLFSDSETAARALSLQ